MEIAINKTGNAGNVSAFLPMVRRLPTGGTHRGFVCDAPNPLAAQVKIYGMASHKLPSEEVLQDLIFTLEL